MTTEQAMAVIKTAAALASLWALYMCWRGYRADALRDDLFGLRDSLFDYAASGMISFSDQAYLHRWRLLNALIHFSDRMTLGRTIIPILLTPKCKEDVRRYAEWRRTFKAVSPDARLRLQQLDEQISMAIARHFIKRSLPFVPLNLALWTASMLNRQLPSILNWCRVWLKKQIPAIEVRALDAENERYSRAKHMPAPA